MASSIVLKRACTSGLFNKLVNPMRSVAVAPRTFNTDSQMEQSIDVDRRSDRSLSPRRDTSPSLFTDVLDPFFSPTRSLSQILNLMDQMMENPFVAPSRGVGGGTRRGWDAKEDENALYVRVDMPGLGKDDLKVLLEQNTLVIKGEGGKEGDDEESVRRYSSRIDLPEKLYKLDEIKAEMKNGILKVIIPKVKEEERKDDVHEVPIE
ncbi:small heat shock protein, chloroplastic-like [Macadamia integrifolia]|uniref:small heat shock protein, chloroplastic-like n=1 Tax=Macadamia integrifolia TaxID=60698 RepID=UPI001C4F5132|nr:small heat shock protein, chloroplastic-like [Macadamia integrifolia]